MLKMFVLLASYALAPVVAGHGMLPMGYLLVPGLTPQWGISPAWLAILFGAVGAVLGPESIRRLLAEFAATVILYLAWLMNVLHFRALNGQAEQGMALESMLLFSTPFQIVTLGVTLTIVVRIFRLLSGRSDTAPR